MRLPQHLAPQTCNEAADGVEAEEKARELGPDVILIDFVMPRKDSIEAIRDIKRENSEARILVLTSFSKDDNYTRHGIDTD